MKTIKSLFTLIAGIAMIAFLGSFTATAVGLPQYVLLFDAGFAAMALIPKGSFSVALMAVTPDLSALTTDFVKFGGSILRKMVNTMDIGEGWTIFKNVKEPIAMPKLSALGAPRPYSADDNTSGNGAKFTDRVLTVYQSKWDFDVDPEVYRNSYLASDSKAPFYQFILEQMGLEYYAAINDSVLLDGVRNGAGTTAAAIADGLRTILTAEATAETIAAITVPELTATTAVTGVETFMSGHSAWKRDQKGVIFCSFTTFDNYKKHYRVLNGFGFNPRANGEYYLDGFKDIKLKGVSWMGTNGGLISSFKNALAFGTDGERIQVAASARRNISEVRLMMPVGIQIADLDSIAISDTFLSGEAAGGGEG